MNCKKCGREISDDSIYCGYCGTQQTEDKPEPAVDATDEKNNDSTSNKSIENEPKKKSMQAVIIGITAAALVLALAIILVISVIFIPKILVGKTEETVAEESMVNDDASMTEDENLKAENVTENAKITVTIMAANETGAISGATVKLSGAGIEISAETDASGTAVFSDIAAGEYNIVCDAEGYHKNETIVNVSESDISPVVALVPEVTGDDAYVLLTWNGDHDLDLCAFNTEMKEYVNIGHPIDSAGNVFLYADHGADLPYEVIYIHNASAEIAKTFYVADAGNARNGSSSQMEADGVTIRVYDSTGLVYENTADSSENAPLWCPCYYYAGTVYDQGDYIHDTTEEQYAWISFDEKDAYTAESSTSAASDAEWKQAYLEYIKTVTEKHWEEYSDLYEDVGYNDIFRFNLIYIDDDDIPELVVSAGYELLVSGHNGNLQKFSFCDDDFMNPPTGLYSGVTSYVEGEGSFIWTGGGHQGCYESVCTLNSSGFSEECNGDIEYPDFDYSNPEYYVSGQKCKDEADYKKKMGYDYSKATDGLGNKGMSFNYDEIITYLTPDESAAQESSTQSNNDSGWKQAYLDILYGYGKRQYDNGRVTTASIVYLDADDVPELAVVTDMAGNNTLGGVYSYIDGKAVEVCSANCSVILGEGLICESFPGDTYPYSEGFLIVKWDKGRYQELWRGDIADEYIDDEYIGTIYSSNGESVSKEEFNRDKKMYFDYNKAVSIGYDMNYDEAIRFLSN